MDEHAESRSLSDSELEILRAASYGILRAAAANEQLGPHDSLEMIEAELVSLIEKAETKKGTVSNGFLEVTYNNKEEISIKVIVGTIDFFDPLGDILD